MIDVLIIGGGPAGLSAALILARCRRSVIVVDSGSGRNERAQEVHGFLTRDGISPEEFRARARRDVLRYGVTILDAQAVKAVRHARGHFSVSVRESSDGSQGERTIESVLLLLATGVIDKVPKLPGFDRFYGSCVHHCPYCDGWEHRDQRLVAFGDGDDAIGLALSLRNWSERVSACTNGGSISAEKRAASAARGITLHESPVRSLEGDGDRLERIVLSGGESLECDALFFNTGQGLRSDLPKRLGCCIRDDEKVETDERQCTGVPGLYLAGDADEDVQFVINAAAEGARAAVAMNRELQERAERAARGSS
jgi:thioredoxin reductase